MKRCLKLTLPFLLISWSSIASAEFTQEFYWSLKKDNAGIHHMTIAGLYSGVLWSNIQAKAEFDKEFFCWPMGLNGAELDPISVIERTINQLPHEIKGAPIPYVLIWGLKERFPCD